MIGTLLGVLADVVAFVGLVMTIILLVWIVAAGLDVIEWALRLVS